DEVILPEEEKVGTGHLFRVLVTLLTPVAGMSILLRGEERLFIRMRDGRIKEIEIMISSEAYEKILMHLKEQGIELRDSDE
ncbi:MAG: hypothetical protein ABEH43_11660, partial [Flavobacteriales bacterium]